MRRTVVSLIVWLGPAEKVTRRLASSAAPVTVIPLHGRTSNGWETRAYGVSAPPRRHTPCTTNRYVPAGVAV